MDFWNNLRKKAYFVDIILLIAAAFAIMGLANFVRLHATKTSKSALKEGISSMNIKYMNELSVEDNSDASKDTSGNTNSMAASGLQDTAKAPEFSSSSTLCAKDCDTIEFETPETAGTLNKIKPCKGLVDNAVNSVQHDNVECPLN